MDLGYARVSTTAQDLDRQLDALGKAGIDPKWTFVDKMSGAKETRPGFTTLLERARSGDVIVAVTLDRLGRNMRNTLNLLHDLEAQGIGVRTLSDPMPIDTSSTEPMHRVALLMIALFGEMERTWINERSAHARAVARAAGKPVGRPRSLDEAMRARIVELNQQGLSIRQIAAELDKPRATVHQALQELVPKPPITTATELWAMKVDRPA